MMLIEQERYNELVSAEERLFLLERAVECCNPYSSTDLQMVKKIFYLGGEKGNAE